MQAVDVIRRKRMFIQKIIDIEGGYVNDPNDPGGETNMGISKRRYPNEDIGSLTHGRASQLYLRDYYEPLRIDEVNDELIAWAIFDTGVHSGVKASARIVQKALNHITGSGLKVDGIIGPVTLGVLNRTRADLLSMVMAALRIMVQVGAVKKDPNTRKFVPGWTRRVRSTVI